MDFGKATLGLEGIPRYFNYTTAVAIQSVLIVTPLLILIYIFGLVAWVCVTGRAQKFPTLGGCHILLSSMASAFVIFSYTTFIVEWPNVGAFWGVICFYWGFVLHVLPIFMYTWWLICILLPWTPEFPYFTLKKGKCKINKIRGALLAKSRWFVWKRVLILFIPSFISMLAVPIKTAATKQPIYMAFLDVSTSWLDPYNQTLIVANLVTTIIFIILYIKYAVIQDLSGGAENADKRMKAKNESIIVLTRAIICCAYGIVCELILWAGVLKKGLADPEDVWIAAPYVLAVAGFHLVDVIFSQTILIVKLRAGEHPNQSQDSNLTISQTDDPNDKTGSSEKIKTGSSKKNKQDEGEKIKPNEHENVVNENG